MTELERALLHIKTRADLWAVREVEKALSQEPSRDINEIAEIMKCDADAETKCKMISNILTAKPHYFEEQEPMRDFTEEEAKAYSKALDKMYKPTGFNVFDEPCTDAVSREAVLDTEYQIKDINGVEYVMLSEVQMKMRKLPSVTQKSGKWILTIEDWNKWTCSNCGYVKRTDIHVNIGWKYCPNCGCRMVEPQESEE